MKAAGTAGPEGTQLLVFHLGAQRSAVVLEAVDRVVQAVEVTPLPGAPPIVRGTISLGGRILPVFDLRKRFGLPERDLALTDQLVIARCDSRTAALLIDGVEAVIERPSSEIADAQQIVPGVHGVAGLLELDDGLVVIQDLARFLTSDEAHSLAEASPHFE